MSGITEDRITVNTCRVCLNTIISESVLLESCNEWLDLYEYCFGLTVNETDEPRKLCLTCAERMKEFAEFKKKCHQSNQLWKTIISNVKCYSEDCRVKDEFEELIVKEEIDIEENIFHNLNDIDDHLEEPISNECDELFEDDRGPSKKKTRRHKKPKRKGRKNKGAIEIKSKLISHHCGLCDFISSDAEATTQHLKEHSLNNELSCKNCEYVGKDFADMVSHRYDHFPKGRCPFICFVCGKRHHNARRIQFHYRSEHLGTDGGWCGVCNLTFKRYRAWVNHERLQHENGKKFICDHCGRAYLYRNQIVAHLEDVSDVKNFICDCCGSAFKRQTYLRLHIKTVHKNDAVKCDHCGLTYKNKYRLQHHLKMVSKKKEFICKVCSKAFVFAVSLKTHEFFHTGERPYPCDICGKRLKKKAELKVHIDRHRGILRHKCTQCPKAFATNRQLRVHGSVHSGVRRHQCAACERSFHEKKALLAHCLSKHNMELGMKTKRSE